MHRTNVYLDGDQVRALKHLAAERQCSVAELVRRAVDDYLGQQTGSGRYWGQRFDDLVARIGSRRQATLPADEIEADITAARAEVRQARADARVTTDGARSR
jgi:hypothetical protein